MNPFGDFDTAANERPRALVLGGGPVGLVAALLLDEQGFQVEVIEREAEVGGLMRSWRSPEGFWFDHGTRFAPRLGLEPVDRALFAEDGWLEFSRPPNGSVFAGRLCAATGFLDASRLPAESRSQVEKDYLSAPGTTRGGGSLAEVVRAEFGGAALEHVFAPVMKKLTGLGPEALLADAHRLFGLGRILLFDAERTRELKKDPRHDRRLAFHCATEGAPSDRSRSFLYPVAGGVGRWVDGMVALLDRRGIRRSTGETIARLQGANNGVEATLASGRSLRADRFVCTLPAALLLQATGTPARRAGPPPTSRTALFHFVVDRPPTTDLFYVTFFDPALASFRVTFYTNVQGGPAFPGKYHFTVESILAAAGAAPEATTVWKELVDVGLFDPSTRVCGCTQQPVGRGFPLPTPELLERDAEDRDRLQAVLPQAVLLGRRADRVFFLRDALRDCLAQLGPAGAPPGARYLARGYNEYPPGAAVDAGPGEKVCA